MINYTKTVQSEVNCKTKSRTQVIPYLLLNNKKGVNFYLLTAVFSIILLSLSFIIYVTPTKSIIEDIGYGKTAKEVDSINYKLAAQKFYVKEEIARSVQKAKIDFSKSYGVNINEQIDIAKSSCEYANVKLWYNEKNIQVETKVKSEDENLEDSKDIKINDNLCIPLFNKDTKNNLESHIKEQITNDLKEGLKPIKTSQDPIVKTSIQSDGKLNVEILVNFEETTKIGKIKDSSKYSEVFDISSYPILLEATSSSLQEFSNKAKIEVPICINKNENNLNTENTLNILNTPNNELTKKENIELLCIKESLINLIEEKYVSIGGTKEDFLKYEFEVQDIKIKEDTSVKGYYVLKIIVNNKETKENELTFAIIFKDSIPTSFVKFSQELFNGVDSTIKVRIFEPEESLDINSYIVIYSYTDFFNEQTYPKYNDFIKMLETNLVPKDFEQAGFYDENGIYYFSKQASNLNLNLLVVNPNNFKEDEETKQKYKDVLLYQNYNGNNANNKWELFENKLVYIYVFGTDENKNYYVKDLSGKSKFITPQKVFGPDPLVNDIDPTIVDSISIPKQVLDISNSFSFEITGYNDLSFDHYDIYIIKNREGKELKENCQEMETQNCIYYNGKSILTQKNGKFLVTSDNTITTKEGYDKIINLPLNTLQSAVEYEILVAPVDSSGKTILSPQIKDYKFRLTNDNHYALEKYTQRLNPEFFKITLKDNEKPNPMTSISILNGNKLNLINDKYYLQWDKIEQDVTGVYVLYQAKDNSQIPPILKKQEIVLVGLDGFILDNNPSFNTIEITKIIPVDSSGNKEDIRTYQGGTYTASYP